MGTEFAVLYSCTVRTGHCHDEHTTEFIRTAKCPQGHEFKSEFEIITLQALQHYTVIHQTVRTIMWPFNAVFLASYWQRLVVSTSKKD